MYYYINLGVTYIKSINIDGKEYINNDYIPNACIKLGVPYIKTLKYNGVEYFNLDYKEPVEHNKDYRGKSLK